MSPELKMVNEIFNRDRPPGLVFNIYEQWLNGKPRAAMIRFYRDNFEEFSEDRKLSNSMWISERMSMARLAVGPNVFLEMAPYVPGRAHR